MPARFAAQSGAAAVRSVNIDPLFVKRKRGFFKPATMSFDAVEIENHRLLGRAPDSHSVLDPI
jgi:hypothetical protein